jgi:hypothetical protein
MAISMWVFAMQIFLIIRETNIYAVTWPARAGEELPKRWPSL